ncbi:MAG: MarR family transcriptional regulator [Myxococcales bacterium]|nr:MarR family transcriptional regulator [Myxococcales bacterium]
MSFDPFTPWQEPAEELERRTVGRDDVLGWLLAACESFLAGQPPTWRLIVGPRGAGKSHLLQLVRARLTRPGITVTWIGEDTPITSNADDLWERIWAPRDRWGWTEEPERRGPRLLLVEGLDRLAGALRPEGRWTLRHHLRESGAMLLGTAVDASFAAGEKEAFFGQLDAWALAPLSLADAGILFDRVTGEETGLSAASLTRREALLRMAGGSPRALLTLAEAVRGTEGDVVGAADGLLGGVQRLVTHYQQRFQELPPLGQQILDVVARAPRELTAGEVQTFTGASSAAVSQAARTLESAGALRRVPDADDARVSRYVLAEPLFRYWLEYRTSGVWAETRAAWFGRLLGEVFTRQELTDVWWRSPSEGVRGAIASSASKDLHYRAQDALLQASSRGEQELALERALELDLDPWDQHQWLWLLSLCKRSDLYSATAAWTAPGVDAVRTFASEIRDEPKQAFTRMLQTLSALSTTHGSQWLQMVGFTIDRLLAELDTRGRPWAPLKGSHADALAGLPFLRVQFALQGRRPTHPPLLTWTRLTRLTLEPATTDLQQMLGAAHQRRDLPFFTRVAVAMEAGGRSVNSNPRPERMAPAPDLLPKLLGTVEGFTWAGSIAGMSPEAATTAMEVLARTTTQPMIAAPEVSAWLTLGLRSPERFEALAARLHDRPTVQDARRLLRQLREREHGRLQPELELVWRAAFG